MSRLSVNFSTLWDELTVSIWFVPLALSLGALLLAITTLYLDAQYGHIPWDWAQALPIDARGVRQVVSVTSAAMITITGVVFSISIVSLTLASNQFGPKILRNYLRDNGNKLVLGLFVGTFIYSLLILASVDTQDGGFVPIVSMVVSLLLTMVAVAGLIYYIHHISTVIQADHIIALIGEELNDSIEQIMQPLEQHGMGEDSVSPEELADRKHGLQARPLNSPQSGYIQTIDYPAIASLVEQHGGLVEIDRRAGHFVIGGCTLGHIYLPRQGPENIDSQILEHMVFGRQRTPIQDIEFTISQLVQIAQRALSPSTNDSLTAITCIDWLSAALGRMAHCRFPATLLRDESATLRLVLNGFSFRGAVNAVFDPLRQSARDNEMAGIRLLEALQQLIAISEPAEYRVSLFNQAQLIHDEAMEYIPGAADRKAVSQRFGLCKDTFEAGENKN